VAINEATARIRSDARIWVSRSVRCMLTEPAAAC